MFCGLIRGFFLVHLHTGKAKILVTAVHQYQGEVRRNYVLQDFQVLNVFTNPNDCSGHMVIRQIPYQFLFCFRAVIAIEQTQRNLLFPAMGLNTTHDFTG